MEIRKPAAAGKFYPASPKEIMLQVESFIDPLAVKEDMLACILPHAGYIYSGEVAVKTVSCINIKEKVILFGPNHTGYGEPFSVMTEGIWQLPTGGVKVDSLLAGKIQKRSQYLKSDFLAHVYEHSLEVEIPILQYFRKNFEIVPIILSSENLNILKEIGKEIALVIKEEGLQNKLTIVASSDMTHYESSQQARNKDKAAIDAILSLDEDKLDKEVKGLDISMCGYAPVVAMLSLAKELGAKAARLVKYATSGDVTGDNTSVVGYAGIIIK